MAMTTNEPTLLDFQNLQNTHAHDHNPVADAVITHLLRLTGEEGTKPSIQTFSSETETEVVSVNILTAPIGEDEVLVATLGNGVTPNKSSVKFKSGEEEVDLAMGQELFTIVAAGEEEAASHSLAGLVFFQDRTEEPLRPGLTLGGQAVQGTALTHALIADRVLTGGAANVAPAPVIVKDELFIAFLAVTLLTEEESTTGGNPELVEFLASQPNSIYRKKWSPAPAEPANETPVAED